MIKKSTTRKSRKPKEIKRTVCIVSKVTVQQKEHIQKLAKECSMTVSDYVLARAYNYEPKARLTEEESNLLKQLGYFRADIIKHASILKGEIKEKRDILLREIPFLREWLIKLTDAANIIAPFLQEIQKRNLIPDGTMKRKKEPVKTK